MKRLYRLLGRVGIPLLLLTSSALGQRERAVGHIGRSARAVPDQYIVRLKDDGQSIDVETLAQKLTRRHNAELLFVYQYAFKGFAASMPEQEALELSLDPRVESVDEAG